MKEQERNRKQEQRYAYILERLRKTGSAAVEDLCKVLGVPVHTIRRDLENLHARGALRRVHGGAAQLEPFFYEPFRSDHSSRSNLKTLPRRSAALLK